MNPSRLERPLIGISSSISGTGIALLAQKFATLAKKASQALSVLMLDKHTFTSSSNSMARTMFKNRSFAREFKAHLLQQVI